MVPYNTSSSTASNKRMEAIVKSYVTSTEARKAGRDGRWGEAGRGGPDLHNLSKAL